MRSMGDPDRRVALFRELEARVLGRYLPDAVEHVVPWGDSWIRVVEVGEGPPVVFLHGITATLGNFASLASNVSARHRCVLMDLPGHGLSGPLTLGERGPRNVLVDALTTLLQHRLPGRAVTLVGNSLGAMTSFYLAADHPDRVAALVVLGEPAYAFPGARARFPLDLLGRRVLGPGTLRLPPPPLALYARVMRRGIGRAALDRMGREVLDLNRRAVWVGRHAGSVAALMRALMGRRGFAAEGVALRDEDLDRIEVPTWFLWGADDPFMSPTDGAPWVQRIAGATIDVVPGAHVPWFDAPDLCRVRLRELLERA